MLDFSLFHRPLILAASAVLAIIIISLVGFYSAIRPAKITSSLTPHDLGLAFEDVDLKTTDGLTLTGWFIPHPDASAPAIILLHGYPADKGNILPAMAWLSQHYHLLLFDFRYLGQSQGHYSTVGARETADLAAAIDWLTARGHTHLGVWGFSLGGAVALMAAPMPPAVKAIIAEESYANLSDMTLQLYPLPLVRYPLAWLTRFWGLIFLGINSQAVSPERAATKIDIPILIIHSFADKVIPITHGQRLRQALRHNPRAEFWFRDDLGHGQLDDSHHQRVETFFAQHLTATIEQ